MNLEVFKEKKVWLFDLDNTIYSPTTKIFDQIDQRMKLFISKKLSISENDARTKYALIFSIMFNLN